MYLRANERVLLIINCLAEHGDHRFRKLYRYIEKFGINVARRYLNGQYRAISVLKNHEATKANFLSILENLVADQRNHAVDLFFQLHGLEGKVRFYDRWILSTQLSREIGQVLKGDNLRLVYNTSCYGDSHSGDFLKAGFRVSVGPLKVNANAATEYPAFCRLWQGKSFGRSREMPVEEVFRRADRLLPRVIQDKIAGYYFDHVDSKKIIRGDSAITIRTAPDYYGSG